MSEIYEIYDAWCHLGCGDCKYHQPDAQYRDDTTCKRLDHKHLQFAVPWFKSYDAGQMNAVTCAEFEPKPIAKWLCDHWVSIQDYMESYERVEGKKYLHGHIGLCIDGDQSVRYYVKRSDFFNGTFVDSDGNLRWEFRKYYKQSRKSPTGYYLVTEERDEADKVLQQQAGKDSGKVTGREEGC